MTAGLIITQGPYSSFAARWASAPGFRGLRLNTVMPVPRDRREERLRYLRRACGARPLWVDLKARQLRVREFANTPYTAVILSRRVSCRVPATVYFDNGRIAARLADIDGDRLILEGYAGRLIGPGESVNIPEASLAFLDGDLFTEGDLEWIEACRSVGVHHYMLSFAESAEDISRLREADPEAVVMAKIESRNGLESLDAIADEADLVLAARGDLYVEVTPPHEVDAAVRCIVRRAGRRAVVGSRILEGLSGAPVPGLADLADLHRLRDLGVRELLLGDDLCFDEELLARAIRVVQAVWSLRPAGLRARERVGSPDSGGRSDGPA
ncbi:MAG: hypothetical protein HY721_13645 [Planctomycetes bacterium]|nr:hypothetical protein [Planctomycetota bacterium]